ncbi:MAG: diiron oxygenase [Candidatus Sericytochromatia bacterium]
MTATAATAADTLRHAVLTGDDQACRDAFSLLSDFDDGRGYLDDVGDVARSLMNKADASEVKLRPYSLAFDMEEARDRPFFPEALTPFYGTAVWGDLNEAQRLFLNHLQFVVHYTGLGFSEKGTIYYDTWASACLPERHAILSDYLRREAEEEHDHIACFWNLSVKILEHYFPGRGLAIHTEMREFIRSSVNQPLYYRSFSSPLLMAKTFELMCHHFSAIAGSFYTLRMFGNMRIKSYDIQNKKDASVHPTIAAMSRDHWEDEARHTAMSGAMGLGALKTGCSKEARSLVWDAFFAGEVGYEAERLFYNSYIFGKGPLAKLVLKHAMRHPMMKPLGADGLRAMREALAAPSTNPFLAEIGAWEVDRYSDMIRRLDLDAGIEARQLAALQRFSQHPLAARPQ